MKKILIFLFFIFLVLVVAEGVYYFYSLKPQATRQDKTIKKQSATLSKTQSNPVVKQKFKILYQAKDDKEGRTIIYQSPNPKMSSGSGVSLDYFNNQYLINPKKEGRPFFVRKSEVKHYSPSDFEITKLTNKPVVSTVIGIFEKWESIKDTKDRLLVLKDPIKKNPLPKARVAFENSSLFGQNPTWINLEDVSIKDHFQKPKVIEEVVKLTPDQINKLIKKDDALVVHFSDNPDFSNKKDKQNHLLVESITIRRLKTDLEL